MNNKITISEFKSHCLEILTKLGTTSKSIIITKRNKPIAVVNPFKQEKKSLFGLLQNKGEINGDIISSINEEWEVEK
jgi:prevent-host-death family protein